MKDNKGEHLGELAIMFQAEKWHVVVWDSGKINGFDDEESVWLFLPGGNKLPTKDAAINHARVVLNNLEAEVPILYKGQDPLLGQFMRIALNVAGVSKKTAVFPARKQCNIRQGI